MICPRASRTTLGGRQYRLHNGPEPVREHPITHHPKIITDDPAQEWQTRSRACLLTDSEVDHGVGQGDAAEEGQGVFVVPCGDACLLYTSPSPRDGLLSR